MTFASQRLAGAFNFSGASVEKTSDQTGIVNNATVTWDAAHWDTDGYFDNANDQFVIPTQGYYLIIAHLQYQDQSAADAFFAFVVTTSQNNPEGGRFTRDTPGETFPGLEGSQILLLDVDDTITVRASGDASFIVRGASNESWFQITRLGLP